MQAVDFYNAKFDRLINFDEKIFYDPNESLVLNESELESLQGLHQVKVEKKAEKIETEQMIPKKQLEEEKYDQMISGATISAIAIISVVLVLKLFFPKLI